MALKQKITLGAFSVWGIYGGVRGWNFYNKEYQMKNEYFERNRKQYHEKDRPTHYYITHIVYAVSGVGYYIFPISGCFAVLNEFYRIETKLRNLNNCKQREYYYNPFYPIYYSRK